MAVDLDEGKVVQVSKSREGFMPGNLVCHGGKVISQGWDGVEVFRQTDALREEISRRLNANPDDAEGLRLLGESRLDEDKLAEAVRNSPPRPPVGAKRHPDADPLRKHCWKDFAATSPPLPRMPRKSSSCWTIRNSELSSPRLMTEGLEKAGRWRPAFDHDVRLLDLEGSDRVLEVADRSWLARRDRWIWGRLRSLSDKADDMVKAEIDHALAERLQAALASKSLDELRNFVDHFDGQTADVAARRALIERLVDSQQFLEAELLLSARPRIV